MNRFQILREKNPTPQIKTLQEKNFTLGMQSCQGQIIDKDTISLDVDEKMYDFLKIVPKAHIEITSSDFKITEFTMNSITAIMTYRDIDNSKEMFRVTIKGKFRLIGSML